MTFTQAPIALPRLPQPLPPHPFPVLASLAPVVASVAIWAFTQSPFAMVFALLGPVIALASLGDSRRIGRKRFKEELTRFHREVEATAQVIEGAHSREIERRERETPSIGALLSLPSHDPERWRGSLEQECLVRLGTGKVVSELSLEPAPSLGEAAGELEHSWQRLRLEAAEIPQAPIAIDARLGVGLIGHCPAVNAAFNAMVVQLANSLHPEDVELVARAHNWPLPEWLEILPHSILTGDSQTSSQSLRHTQAVLRVDFRSRASRWDQVGADRNSGACVVAAAAREEDLPRECRIVIRIADGGSTKVVRHPNPTGCVTLAPVFVSMQQAREFSTLLCAARAMQPEHSSPQSPSIVEFTSLSQPESTGRDSLSCCLGLSANGPVTVDLVAEGPHAIIGGTTGSGKSELLVTWVLAMAASHSPELVNFLLIDFKGGASFSPVMSLPHSVGILTDLNEGEAARALLSLRAELRYRERVLLEHGVRSISELAISVVLPRLVIVVDEFAALAAGFPQLHELFSDLAARGRSLGVHLILCTQRPGGSVRDSVLANCTLRISLRVNNAADSVAVIGSPQAAQLAKIPVGRALLALQDAGEIGEVFPFQVAVAGEPDLVAAKLGEAHAGHRGTRSPRRPWLDPLPSKLLIEQIPTTGSSGVVFGAIDVPEEQRQEAAVYDPARQGSLLVLGGQGSGKSGLLNVIGQTSQTLVRWIPSSVEGAWDVIARTLEEVRSTVEKGMLLLFDDLDSLIGRYPPEHEQGFVDQLISLLREGSAQNVHLVITSRRLGSGIQSLAALCESRLLLRMPDRQEHVLAGGQAATFDAARVPGSGLWNDHRVQVAHVPKGLRPDPEASLAFDIGSWPGLAVVAVNPASLRTRLSKLGEVVSLDNKARTTALDTILVAPPRPQILLGNQDAWNSEWGLLESLRPVVPILFHGCSVTEFRAISRSRVLPPPICAGSGGANRESAWLLTPHGQVSRVVLS